MRCTFNAFAFRTVTEEAHVHVCAHRQCLRLYFAAHGDGYWDVSFCAVWSDLTMSIEGLKGYGF